MPVVNALMAVVTLLDVLTQMSNAVTEFQTIVGKAQREGRDLTPEEAQAFSDAYGKALDRLKNTP